MYSATYRPNTPGCPGMEAAVHNGMQPQDAKPVIDQIKIVEIKIDVPRRPLTMSDIMSDPEFRGHLARFSKQLRGAKIDVVIP